MTLPRRPRPMPHEKQGTVNDAMVPGSFRGRLPVVAPVTPRKQLDARNRGITAVSNPAGRSSRIDEFTLTASGAQDLALSYQPIMMSWNVELRGVKAKNGTDYTIGGQTLSLLAALDARTGDDVQIQYDYLTGVPSTPTSGTGAPFVSLVRTTGTDNSATVNLPTGATSGLFVMLFTSGDRFNVSATPAGWTFRGHVLNWWSNLYVYTKPVTGTEGSTVSFAMGTDSNTFYAITAVYDATTVQNVAVSASGDASGGGPSGSDFTQPSVNVTSLAARIVHCTVGAHGVTGMAAFTMGTDVTVRDQFPYAATAEISLGDFAATATGTSPTEVAHSVDSAAWAGITLAIA